MHCGSIDACSIENSWTGIAIKTFIRNATKQMKALPVRSFCILWKPIESWWLWSCRQDRNVLPCVFLDTTDSGTPTFLSILWLSQTVWAGPFLEVNISIKLSSRWIFAAQQIHSQRVKFPKFFSAFADCTNMQVYERIACCRSSMICTETKQKFITFRVNSGIVGVILWWCPCKSVVPYWPVPGGVWFLASLIPLKLRLRRMSDYTRS